MVYIFLIVLLMHTKWTMKRHLRRNEVCSILWMRLRWRYLQQVYTPYSTCTPIPKNLKQSWEKEISPVSISGGGEISLEEIGQGDKGFQFPLLKIRPEEKSQFQILKFRSIERLNLAEKGNMLLVSCTLAWFLCMYFSVLSCQLCD